jgi:hypothetical protein
MAWLTKFALFGWTPLILYLFQRTRQKHRALIFCFVAGALFLPEIQLSQVSPDAPDSNEFKIVILKFTKPNTISFAALLGALLFDRRRLFRFRPRWYDLPMLVWCVVPYFSNSGMGTSFYDSLMSVRDQTLSWGIPYLLGRVYFTNFEAFRDLAIAIVLGGLVYVPLCLLEKKVAPQLNSWVYGFWPGQDQFNRDGGYRPMVFMSHGLACALWLAATTVVAFWLWYSGAVPKLRVWPLRRPVSMLWAALALMGTAAVANSLGALSIGIGALVAVFQLRLARLPIILLALLLVSPAVIWLRTSGWSAKEELDWLRSQGPEMKIRADSFGFRVDMEDRLLKKMPEKPMFGFGDTGEARKAPIEKRDEKPEVVVDSRWIICLSSYGYVGLVACWTSMLLPAALFMWYYPPRTWFTPALAPGVAAAVVLIMYMIDNISNAMNNPAFLLLNGALAGVLGARMAKVVEVLPVEEEEEEAPPPVPADPRRPGVLVRNRLLQ